MASSTIYSTGYFYYQFYQGNHSCNGPVMNSFGYLLNQCYNGYSAYGVVVGSVVYQCAGNQATVNIVDVFHKGPISQFMLFFWTTVTGTSATVSVYSTANCAGIPQSSFVQQLGDCYLEEEKAFQPLCSSTPSMPIQVPSVLYRCVNTLI